MKLRYQLMRSLKMLAFVFSLLFTQASQSQGSWAEKASLSLTGRSGAVSFTIGDKIYAGTGNYQNDFWEYNPATNTWLQKASLPGVGRSFAVGFSIGTKGYIGTGAANNGIVINLLNDFWEYDQPTNTWVQKADFAGLARYDAFGFSIGNKGYIGTGMYVHTLQIKRSTSTFYEYNPSNDQWTSKAPLPPLDGNYIVGGGRHGAIGCSIGNTGYAGMGLLDAGCNSTMTCANGKLYNDFWAYYPLLDQWVQKASLPASGRNGAAAFTIADKVYVGTGLKGKWLWASPPAQEALKDFWEYDTLTNVWLQKPDFPVGNRHFAIGAGTSTKGYIGTGVGTNDFWEYTPNVVLPVKLLYFSGNFTAQNTVALSWATANEQNNKGYHVERSPDGLSFQSIGFVASRAIGGTTNNTSIYQFKDNPGLSGKVFYRIKQVDNDGRFDYSKTIAIHLKAGPALFVKTIYPNPVRESLVLELQSSTPSVILVAITDAVGRLVLQQKRETTTGDNQVNVDVRVLKPAVYILTLYSDDNSILKTFSIIKQ